MNKNVKVLLAVLVLAGLAVAGFYALVMPSTTLAKALMTPPANSKTALLWSAPPMKLKTQQTAALNKAPL
ncbi:MAG TPA: hypothetical protein PLO23_04055 [Alphaproteobacteria bacterium]|nr:hypothetical protein [Alphaproteobacteria bacterium]